MSDQLAIRYRPTSELFAYAKNSRTHSEAQVEQIAASMREFGFNNPVLIDAAGTIIAGHGRVLAARLVGIEQVPTIELGHLTDAQRRAYVIADNKIALNSGWDLAALSAEMVDLQGLGFDLGLTGFGGDELQKMFGPKKGRTDKDDAPDLPIVSVTQPGDQWLMGAHRLLCGDATSADAVLLVLDGEKADLWLTDPPYNVEYVGKTKDALTIRNDAMSDEAFRDFLRRAHAGADGGMRAGAAFYVWHADSEGYNFRGACRDVGWQVRQCLIWAKNTMVLGRQDYQWRHEPCLYGWKGGRGTPGRPIASRPRCSITTNRRAAPCIRP